MLCTLLPSELSVRVRVYFKGNVQNVALHQSALKNGRCALMKKSQGKASPNFWFVQDWWWWNRASRPRMSVDIFGTSWDQCVSMAQYCCTSTETRRLVRTESPRRPPRLSHSSWTLICPRFSMLLICPRFSMLLCNIENLGQIKSSGADDEVMLNVLRCRLTY